MSVIPFSKPTYLGTEFLRATKDMEEALSASPRAVPGPIATVEKLLSALYDTPVLLTSSATHALEIMALCLNLQPGDEVVVPSFTFVSTANAFLLHGAKVAFADCDSAGNISLESVKRLLTPKTRAVVAVDYAGGSCDFAALKEICDEQNILLLEDAAQGIGAKYRETWLGGLGAMACLSFQDTKNLHCGEGGALILNDVSFLQKVQIIRDKGTNRQRFLEGLVDKYTWVSKGSSYVIASHSASFLADQLSNLEAIQSRRISAWLCYEGCFRNKLPAGVSVLFPPAHNTFNAHIFALKVRSLQERKALLSFLRSSEISAAFHYVPLHLSSFAQENSGLVRFDKSPSVDGGLPMQETVTFSDTLLRLPLFHGIEEGQIEKVVLAVQRFYS